MERTCGGCTLCCKLMKVGEIDKPAGAWCPSCVPGKGCGVYDTRPGECRDFRCLWLQGFLRDEWRPDRIKAVVTSTNGGRTVQVREDASYGHEASRAQLRPFVEGLVASGHVVEICRGGSKRVIAPARVPHGA